MTAADKAPVSVLVTDANAFISGTRLDRFNAQHVVTVKEVVGEVRDASARQMMTVLLPEGVTTKEPTREAVEHGTCEI